MCIRDRLYAVWIAVHWCTWSYGDANRRTVHQRAECVDVRRRTQGWRKQRKVQNMPLIWCISYHAINSSHVTDHFLSTLLSLHYMCCVAWCWKSRLTPAVLRWTERRRHATGRRRAAPSFPPRRASVYSNASCSAVCIYVFSRWNGKEWKWVNSSVVVDNSGHAGLCGVTSWPAAHR